MPKVTHSTGESHPEGWFLFVILGSELVTGEYKGKKSVRVKFNCQSTERKEDGEAFELALWTGTVVSDHTNCKLTQLIQACECDPEEFEDTDELNDSIFAGKVERNEATGYANIVAFDTKDRIRPKAKKAAKKSKPDFNDPFADE